MNDRPSRVTVTHPRTNAAERPRRVGVGRRSPANETLPPIAVDAIVAAQWRLAVRSFAALVAVLVSVPLVVTTVPFVRELRPLGVPIAWFAIGIGFFPPFLLLGDRYVRASERIDETFTDLVERL